MPIEFEAADIAASAKPGQFIILRVDEQGERFPLTVYDVDLSKGRVTVVCQAVGVSTKKLCALTENSSIMDAARSALRLGAEKVCVVYRRTEDEMPARLDEIHHAKEEGVEFRLLTTPVKIEGDDRGNVIRLICLKNELGEPDSRAGSSA